jgi:hypothetical protein
LTTATPSIVSNFHQQLYQIQNSHSALYSLILVKLSQKKKKKKGHTRSNNQTTKQESKTYQV